MLPATLASRPLTTTTLITEASNNTQGGKRLCSGRDARVDRVKQVNTKGVGGNRVGWPEAKRTRTESKLRTIKEDYILGSANRDSDLRLLGGKLTRPVQQRTADPVRSLRI